MARLIVLTVILVIILILLGVWMVTSRRWRTVCEDHGDRTEVWLRKGAQSHFIGAAERMHDDYADRVLALQSKAQDKQHELNSLRKVLGQ